MVCVGKTNNKKICSKCPSSHCLSSSPREKHSDILIFGTDENDGKHGSSSQITNLSLSSHLHKLLTLIDISYHYLWYAYWIESLECKLCSFFPLILIFWVITYCSKISTLQKELPKIRAAGDSGSYLKAIEL